MKILYYFRLLIILSITFFLFSLQSCKKNTSSGQSLYLNVDVPRSVLQNNLYYLINNNDRTIEMEFSQPLDTSSIRGNISFTDKTGSLNNVYSLITIDRKIVLVFNPGFTMKRGWRYLVTIGTGMRSTSGISFSSPKILEFRTSAFSFTTGCGSSGRNAMVCISDIHMGEYRGVTRNYCWFSNNEHALHDLLDTVLKSREVRELVILGDLFDEWVIPFRMSPFDTVAGIHDTREYFLSVAASPVNQPIIDKLRAIAVSDSIELIYVPGNHDMLMTQSILEEIIPGIIWKGTVPGLGNYSPVDEMILEHGHRFDLFNCPQPLVNNGHMLPPGFFISRLQAEGLKEHGGPLLKEALAGEGSGEFLLAWTLAYEYLCAQYSLILYTDSANILMDGIDGYSAPFSYNGARDMYSANIESQWPATEQQNRLPLAIPVAMAILDGNEDLFLASSFEYLSSGSPKRYKIAVFGHTHKPEIKVTPAGNNYQGIYANTGSWVNPGLTNNQTRTFVMIWPGKWTGSDLDVVTVYRYDLNSGSGKQNPDYIPVLMAEESILTGN